MSKVAVVPKAATERFAIRFASTVSQQTTPADVIYMLRRKMHWDLILRAVSRSISKRLRVEAIELLIEWARENGASGLLKTINQSRLSIACSLGLSTYERLIERKLGGLPWSRTLVDSLFDRAMRFEGEFNYALELIRRGKLPSSWILATSEANGADKAWVLNNVARVDALVQQHMRGSPTRAQVDFVMVQSLVRLSWRPWIDECVLRGQEPTQAGMKAARQFLERHAASPDMVTDASAWLGSMPARIEAARLQRQMAAVRGRQPGASVVLTAGL